MKQHLPAIYQSEDLLVVLDLLAGTDKVQCRIGLARVGVTRGVAADNSTVTSQLLVELQSQRRRSAHPSRPARSTPENA